MIAAQKEKALKPMFEGIRQVIYGDPLYPANLEESSSAAVNLWYRGTLKKEDRIAVAVVGSRHCSGAGQKRAFKLGAQLAGEGITVVSGLAQGIDGAAHRGALAVGGRTLAVLGTGLNCIYPSQHEELAEKILDSGSAILSQFLPEYRGSRGGKNFLQRNHVIAGMSQILVVVEGEKRSGTAAAVRAALSQGRPVGLLRSLVESRSWAHQLVNSGQAFQVASLDDIVMRVSF